MSSHDPQPTDRKGLKAWFLRKRRRRDLLLFYQQRQLEREEEKQKKEAVTLSPKKDEEKQDDVLWSAKTQEIRNRLTDKKRMAAERWNRFAATEDAGGRGL